jgi:hypothetical protein
MSARLTLDRAIYNKLVTQLRRPANAPVAPAILALQRTESPKHDSIFWDPPAEVVGSILDILKVELTFIRKKESDSFKKMEENIRRCETYLRTTMAHSKPT